MIIGLGSDLIDIRRIEKTLERFGDRFLDRIFTEVERTKSDRRAGRVESYAKRFAAKEACSKALGTGLRKGVFWRDMGVINLPGGKPTMKLTGGAAERLAFLTPPGMKPIIDITITSATVPTIAGNTPPSALTWRGDSLRKAPRREKK